MPNWQVVKTPIGFSHQVNLLNSTYIIGHNVLKHWEENAENWTAFTRAGYDLYRDVLSTLSVLAFLLDIVFLTGLDIGCGEEGDTRFLAKKVLRCAASTLRQHLSALAVRPDSGRS